MLGLDCVVLSRRLRWLCKCTSPVNLASDKDETDIDSIFTAKDFDVNGGAVPVSEKVNDVIFWSIKQANPLSNLCEFSF